MIPRLRLARVAEYEPPPYGDEPARHPDQLAEWLRTLIDPDNDTVSESFWVLHLDARNQIIGCVRQSEGGWSGAVVKPREVFAAALLNGAQAIVIAHNHPSGDPTPSHQDRQLTNQLCEAGKLLGVKLLDHIVLGTPGGYLSFRESGLLD
ncbi:hypothetical protein LCGC14_1042940 [marine sediment metagenome]|uniref:MPN domain-containing protein n=1 Tax=marine sediment metagenome TaxID=412755 RepID=A0A0F9Q9E9_9ZZZZ